MMAFTEGNTNRECTFFLEWDGGLCGMVGLGWMEENKKSGAGM